MIQLSLRPYWYLRHGQTDWNRDGLSQGRTDVPLNETGHCASRCGGQAVETCVSKYTPFTHIVSSPLDRAFQTAAIVREGLIAKGFEAFRWKPMKGLKKSALVSRRPTYGRLVR
jgi:probable phosphoglycerate mutase